MTAPLVVLAVLSVFGGALNLPFGDSWHILATFLEPVLELETPDGVVVIEAKSTASDSLKFLLASLAAATAFAGIAAGYFLWRRSVDRPELEPELLKNAWYVDAALARTVSGPVTALAEGAAWYDSYAIDGAVEGVATGVGQGGGLLRKVQNGFVRSYALVMVGGVVAVLAFLLVVTR
jgi:NADH-quinone oxidoreductase subunit L